MLIPSSTPEPDVLVDGVEEQRVKEPDERWVLCVEPVVCLQVEEEIVPLLGETLRGVVPDSLNPGVVLASEKRKKE